MRSVRLCFWEALDELIHGALVGGQLQVGKVDDVGGGFFKDPVSWETMGEVTCSHSGPVR